MEKSPISELVEQLKKDKGYRYGWVANIAMAYKDNYAWYKDKTGKKVKNIRKIGIEGVMVIVMGIILCLTILGAPLGIVMIKMVLDDANY